MRKVFISSVIEGYEDRREAARNAIELMDDRPIMAEHLGARPDAPNQACLTEVAQSDVYLLLMGHRYGFKTSNSISVTHAEFREAKAIGKPVLALIEDVRMEPEQDEFRREVEDFETGFFRDTFTSPAEAKDKIIRALRRLDQARHASTRDEFQQRLDQAAISTAVRQGWLGSGPVLTCAWWPQPAREIDIVGLEQELDACFDTACEQGLAVKRHGYTVIRGRDHTGLTFGAHALHIFDDGLRLFTADPTVERSGMLLSSCFVPPSRVRELALAASRLFDGNGAWCQLRLQNMEGKNFDELPEQNQNSVTMPMWGDDQATLNRRLIPFSHQAYQQWVATALGQFGRIFGDRL